MEIGHWMTKPVHTLKPRDTLARARELMEQHRLNQLPVVVDGRLVGIVSDRDVRDASPSLFESAPTRRRGRALPADADPRQIPVEVVMTAHVLTLSPTDPMTAAAQIMRRERFGSVPIVEGERLVGILSRSDILEAFLELSSATQDLLKTGVPRPSRSQ